MAFISSPSADELHIWDAHEVKALEDEKNKRRAQRGLAPGEVTIMQYDNPLERGSRLDR